MTWFGIEPRSPGPLTNTLPTRPHYCKIKYIYNQLEFNIRIKFVTSKMYSKVVDIFRLVIVSSSEDKSNLPSHNVTSLLVPNKKVAH